MDIQTLKRAAEFVGTLPENLELVKGDLYVYNVNEDMILFNPHQETGAHWLKKMELKLSPEQWENYKDFMLIEFLKENPDTSFLMWFKTAKCSVCFPIIMEVIPNSNVNKTENPEHVRQVMLRKASFVNVNPKPAKEVE